MYISLAYVCVCVWWFYARPPMYFALATFLFCFAVFLFRYRFSHSSRVLATCAGLTPSSSHPGFSKDYDCLTPKIFSISALHKRTLSRSFFEQGSARSSACRLACLSPICLCPLCMKAFTRVKYNGSGRCFFLSAICFLTATARWSASNCWVAASLNSDPVFLTAAWSAPLSLARTSLSCMYF